MKIIKTSIKVIMAGILASLILSFIFSFYTFSPIHINNDKGNTDYVWKPNSKWIKMSEGISYGKFDSQGFNNKKAILDPDIIILGSSHMEATDVLYEKSVAGILNSKFKDKTIYNYGISGHDFYKILYYLPYNLKNKSKTPQIAIIETSTVLLTEDEVESAFNNEFEHVYSHNSGIKGIIQRFPFFKQLYHQYQHGILNIFIPQNIKIGISKDVDNSIKKNKHKKIINEEKDKNTVNYDPYEKVFSYLQKTEKEYGTQIIIFFHPLEYFNKDGSISFVREGIEKFTEYSAKYDIDFIDMTNTFEEMYYKQHNAPHGFITGNVGYGHLNVHGHAAIANELYKLIKEKEGK